MTDQTAIQTEPDKAFLEYIVKQLADNLDQIQIERKIDALGVLLTLKVAKEDMGKIIGKNGQTAQALRTLLRIIGSKHNQRVNLKIIEPDGTVSNF